MTLDLVDFEEAVNFVAAGGMPQLEFSEYSWLLAAMMLVAGSVLWIANQARQVFASPGGATQIEPNPLEVRKATELATSEDHERLEACLGELDGKIEKYDGERRASVSRCYTEMEQRTDELRKSMKEDIGNLRHEIKEDTYGIHERINDVLVAVSKVQGKLEN